MKLKIFLLLMVNILVSLYSIVYAQDNQEQTIKVDSFLVNVPVIITDKSDKFIQNLKVSDFAIYSDQKKQEISVFETAEAPLEIIIMLDTSTSMEQFFEEIKKSAIEFVKNLRPIDKALIVSFDTKPQILSEFTGNSKNLEIGINKLSPSASSYKTAIYDSLSEVIENQFKPNKSRKAIILLTDGVDTGSGRSFSGLRFTLSNSSIVIYCISYLGERVTLSGEKPENIVKQIVDFTGGRNFEAAQSNTKKVFQEITKELQNQYQLGFYPSDDVEGEKFHSIKVEVKDPKLKVRTRNSYYVKK